MHRQKVTYTKKLSWKSHKWARFLATAFLPIDLTFRATVVDEALLWLELSTLLEDRLCCRLENFALELDL